MFLAHVRSEWCWSQSDTDEPIRARIDRRSISGDRNRRLFPPLQRLSDRNAKVLCILRTRFIAFAPFASDKVPVRVSQNNGGSYQTHQSTGARHVENRHAVAREDARDGENPHPTGIAVIVLYDFAFGLNDIECLPRAASCSVNLRFCVVSAACLALSVKMCLSFAWLKVKPAAKYVAPRAQICR